MSECQEGEKSRFFGAQSAAQERATEPVLVSFFSLGKTAWNDTKISSVALSYTADWAPKKRDFRGFPFLTKK